MLHLQEDLLRARDEVDRVLVDGAETAEKTTRMGSPLRTCILIIKNGTDSIAIGHNVMMFPNSMYLPVTSYLTYVEGKL